MDEFLVWLFFRLVNIANWLGDVLINPTAQAIISMAAAVVLASLLYTVFAVVRLLLKKPATINNEAFFRSVSTGVGVYAYLLLLQKLHEFTDWYTSPLDPPLDLDVPTLAGSSLIETIQYNWFWLLLFVPIFVFAAVYWYEFHTMNNSLRKIADKLP